MNAAAATPGANAGEHTLRLDADRTRDELADVLVEIRHRLAPKELARSATDSLRRHPKQVAGVIAATAGIVTGIVLLTRRATRRG
jgi:ElaB/YqjD/DUF883 family membrane-anchored ribosome-binding protein